MGVGGQRQAPAALPPVKRPDTHCIRGWVGPRARLDGYGKTLPHRDSMAYQVLRYWRVCPAIHPIKTVLTLLKKKADHVWPAAFCPI
jgi:hypothetical protein